MKPRQDVLDLKEPIQAYIPVERIHNITASETKEQVLRAELTIDAFKTKINLTAWQTSYQSKISTNKTMAGIKINK